MKLTVEALEILVRKGFTSAEILDLARALQAAGDEQAERRRAADRERAKKRREMGKSANASAEKSADKSADESAEKSADSPQTHPPQEYISTPPVPISDEIGVGGRPGGKNLFDLGVEILTAKGRTEATARSILGKFQKEFGDPAVLDALNRFRNATDPVSAMRSHLGKSRAQREYYGV